MEGSPQDSKGDRAPKGLAVELSTVLAIVGAVLLIVSSFLNVFDVDDVRGHAIAGAARTGEQSHGPALLLIGIVVIAAVFFARSTEQYLPAAGAAALGMIALMIVLFGDLPDAHRSALVESGQLGDASPAAGLWVELVGALVVIVSSGGVALISKRR